MTNPNPLTIQQLAEIEAIAARIADDPFFVADCEGQLAVWREKALTHVRRDEHGQIDTYSLPSSYQSTDEVIETIHLDSWDPGEDATDDQRRQDINDLVDSRAWLPALLAMVRRLQGQRKYLLTQLAKRDAETGRGDRALREFLTAHPGEDVETPAAVAEEACGKCRQPFDPADTRFDGRARYHETPYCRGCVDRCHDNEIADHRCVICA
ncbi:hypothetical protein [Streptomyces pseudovenezuelae]|uniref:hypothetical protein n=1 Tax=Streptomyces pseudovenezuelae TaxID=67350 RepID=UPI0036E617B1